MRIQPIMLGGAKLPRVRGEGRRAKVRGQMAESGGEILRRGSKPYPHQLGVWGIAISSASGVRG